MYRYAAKIFLWHWDMILIASILLYMLDVWSSGSSLKLIVPKFVVYGFVIYFFHLAMLKGSASSLWGKDATKQQPDRHFWLAFTVPLISIIFLTFALFFVLKLFPSLQGLPKNALMGWLTIFIVLYFGLFLSCFGTVLPAAVLGESVGFKEAFKRSRRSLWFVLWRLIVGPFVFMAVLIFLIVFAGSQGISVNTPVYFSEITFMNALWNVVIGALAFFGSALTAAILSMAYLRVEHNSIPDL